MSTCPRCYDDTGCTCEEHDRIKALEAENARLREALEDIAGGVYTTIGGRHIAKQALKEQA